MPREFLARMVGADVAAAVRELEAARAIGYEDGTLAVLDRPGLERASCDCYAIIRERPAPRLVCWGFPPR